MEGVCPKGGTLEEEADRPPGGVILTAEVREPRLSCGVLAKGGGAPLLSSFCERLMTVTVTG